MHNTWDQKFIRDYVSGIFIANKHKLNWYKWIKNIVTMTTKLITYDKINKDQIGE